jgi:signal transduction histidine kinase
VTRYAQASAVRMELSTGGKEIMLRIHDNGRGISEADARGTKSFGLLGMRERARLLGGTFEIRGENGVGTTLTVRIPAPQTAAVPT